MTPNVTSRSPSLYVPASTQIQSPALAASSASSIVVSSVGTSVSGSLLLSQSLSRSAQTSVMPGFTSASVSSSRRYVLGSAYWLTVVSASPYPSPSLSAYQTVSGFSSSSVSSQSSAVPV